MRFTQERRGGLTAGRAVLAAGLALAAWATHAAADVGQDEVTVRDSAGVRIVVNPSSRVAAVPTIELVEELRIGVRDGPEDLQFVRVRGVREGPGGEILVLDYGQQRLRIFSPTGEFARALGREGDGPGEFRSPAVMAVKGDTILVKDREVSLFVGGEHLTTLPVYDPSLQTQTEVIAPTPAGWRATHLKRGYGMMENAREGGPFTDTVYVRGIDLLSAQLTDTIARFPVSTWYQIGGSLIRGLFEPTIRPVLARDGRIFAPSRYDYTIDIHAPSGRLATRIQTEVDRIRVTEAHFDAYYARRRAASEGSAALGIEGMLRLVDTEQRRLPRPEFRPVLGDLIVAPGGRFLAERVDLGPEPYEEWDGSSTWDYYGSDGVLAGRLALPRTIRPVELTDRSLYAVVMDEFDVQYVARFRLEVDPGW